MGNTPISRVVDIYRFYRDLFTNFALVIQRIFGGDFFKKIEFSFSDYTFTVKNYLNNPGADLQEPALIVKAGEFKPFQGYNRTGVFFNLFPSNTFQKQILCVNETRNEYIAAVYDYFTIQLIATISTSSNFESIQIKHYLQQIFPVGYVFPFPSEGAQINTLIPLFDYQELLPNWDFDNDEIYYYLKVPGEQLFKTEEIVGDTTPIFLEYSYTPIVTVQDLSKDQDRNIVQSVQFASNSISFEFIVPVPLYLLIGRGAETIKEVTLKIENILNKKLYFSETYSYTSLINLIDKVKEVCPDKNVKFFDGFILNSNLNLVENNNEKLVFKVEGTKLNNLKDYDKNDINILIPVMDYLLSSNQSIANTAPIDFDITYLENLNKTEIRISIPKTNLDPIVLNALLSPDIATSGYIITCS